MNTRAIASKSNTPIYMAKRESNCLTISKLSVMKQYMLKFQVLIIMIFMSGNKLQSIPLFSISFVKTDKTYNFMIS